MSNSLYLVDTIRIAKNVTLGKEARQAFKFLEEEFGTDKEQHFWEVILDLVKEKLPQKMAIVHEAMTDEEASKFENKVVPYGQYAGDDVRDVPVDYLLFLVDGDSFIKKVRRYVRSDKFKRREKEWLETKVQNPRHRDE